MQYSRDNAIRCAPANDERHDRLPEAFCWTKMGAEAGQSLQTILARKDAERHLGNGVFFWGIGCSLGARMWRFVNSVTQPRVVFTPMRTRPKDIDVSPKRVCVWRAYLD